MTVITEFVWEGKEVSSPGRVWGGAQMVKRGGGGGREGGGGGERKEKLQYGCT